MVSPGDLSLEVGEHGIHAPEFRMLHCLTAGAYNDRSASLATALKQFSLSETTRAEAARLLLAHSSSTSLVKANSLANRLTNVATTVAMTSSMPPKRFLVELTSTQVFMDVDEGVMGEPTVDCFSL